MTIKNNKKKLLLIFSIIIALIIMALFIINKYFRNTKVPYLTNNSKYNIIEIPSFISNEECDRIINISIKKGLQKSELYVKDSDEIDTNIRNSNQVWLSDEIPEAKNISEKVEKLLNIPKSHQEELQVLQYNKNGKYDPHYDACNDMDDEENACKRMNGNAGPRYLTVIIYLNDDFTGGTTYFPLIDKHIIPVKGKALIFQDTEYRKPYKVLEKSIHGGEPIIDGSKWIMTKWIHHNEYN